MSKRIKQTISENRIDTYTTGNPRGNLPNFDVNVTSFNPEFKKATEFNISYFQSGKRRVAKLDGRQARTIYDILDRHFAELDN